jgi:hypothetical protein
LTFKNGKIKTTWVVVLESGTGNLSGLRGEDLLQNGVHFLG